MDNVTLIRIVSGILALAFIVVPAVVAWGIYKGHREQLDQNQQAALSAAILCSNCGKYSAPGIRFCRTCGQEFAAVYSKT
jgi:hypothetical protein